MFTVSQFARQCGLSRSTVLYYESIGLLKPAMRGGGNYRRYGDREVSRLRQICALRGSGLSLADVRALLDGPQSAAAAVLKRRLVEIDAEIETLRRHQRSILKLLRASPLIKEKKMITKDQWVSIMKRSGLTEDDMHRWHAEFEKSAPEQHQEFLEFLHIPAEEIRGIRDWSRKQAGRV